VKGKKYSVILMHDDASVKKFRLRPFWIKSWIALFMVLVVISAGGIYFSWIFFQEKQEKQAAYQEKAALLEETQQELKELRDVQKLFQSFMDPDLESYMETGDFDRDRVPPGLDLNRLFQYEDRDIVDVSNVQARFVDEDIMRVELDVNNMLDGETVSGRVYLYLISRQGLKLDLDLDHPELNYVISRFKPVDVTFELPRELTRDDIFALRVQLKDDDGTQVYSETFPLTHILV